MQANVLQFSCEELDGSNSNISLHNARCFNVGFTLSDREAQKAHMEELRKIGLDVPTEHPGPVAFPFPRWSLVTDSVIEVSAATTSGEAEFVLIRTSNGDLFVSVGSDHTDREIERENIALSKTVAPNIVAGHCWRYSDIEPGWKSARLEALCDGRPYQSTSLDAFIDPDQIISFIDARFGRSRVDDIVVFCGTVPTVDGTVRFGTKWLVTLEDVDANRTLTCEYRVDLLPDADDVLLNSR